MGLLQEPRPSEACVAEVGLGRGASRPLGSKEENGVGKRPGKKTKVQQSGRGRSGNSRDVRVNQGSNQVLKHFDNLTLP